MKFSYQILSIIFALFIVGLFGWAFFSPKPDISARIEQTLKEQEKVADLTFKDVTFEEALGGIKYWELQAVNALVNKSTGIAALRQSNGNFFRQGKATLRFLSPAALWDMKKKEILLDQPFGYDVSLQNKVDELRRKASDPNISQFNLPALAGQESYWFKAKNLSWSLADEKLLCTGGILLSKGEVTGYAKQLSGDVALEHVVLSGDPKLLIKQPDGSLITIEAKTFEIDTPQNLITGYGEPQIHWGEAEILAGALMYRQKENLLVMADQVVIDYNDIKAWGESGEYFTREQKIILSGRARAVQGENKLTGKQVAVSLKEKKISVVGKGKVVISEETINNDNDSVKTKD